MSADKLIREKQQIEDLLRSQERAEKRIEKIRKVLMQEKENEEAWPGHAGTRYQQAEEEYQVLLDHLKEVKKELREKRSHKG